MIFDLWLKGQGWTLAFGLALLAVFVPLGGTDLVPRIAGGVAGISLGVTFLCMFWSWLERQP